jgi:integrase
LRHSFATRAARALHGDVVAVAALLGHRSYATTRRYVSQWQPDAEQLRGLYADAA